MTVDDRATAATDVQEALPLPGHSEATPAVEFRAPGDGSPRYTVEHSPIGDLLLVGDGESLTGLFMAPHRGAGAEPGPEWRADPGAFASTVRQLRAYFAGELRTFDVPLAPRGTEFQRRVWRALTTIPYGRTATYGAIAAQIGRPSAVRAVGAANGRNPISIIVPCHRVIGSDGTLTGYGGGLDRKEHLLALERR